MNGLHCLTRTKTNPSVEYCIIFSTQHFLLARFVEFVANAPEEHGLRSVLTKAGNLYGLWRLEKHVGTLYQGTTWCVLLSLPGVGEGSLQNTLIFRWLLHSSKPVQACPGCHFGVVYKGR